MRGASSFVLGYALADQVGGKSGKISGGSQDGGSLFFSF
jgi:hypothetical protein